MCLAFNLLLVEQLKFVSMNHMYIGKAGPVAGLAQKPEVLDFDCDFCRVMMINHNLI